MITLEDVWLKYRIAFKEGARAVCEDFWALKGIDLNVGKGECFAVIGENGSGKTTLLRVISGMLMPDKGRVRLGGRVAGLMEIQAGFHPELTGRENIYNISALSGLSADETGACYADMVEFAAIGRFINAPVKTYSQGMLVRLAFAIAIHARTDILLVDDIFAVGDIYARRKCINKMFELKDKGLTIIFVSHDLDIARRLCKRGVLLREGRVIRAGSIDGLVSYYLETVGNKEGIALLQKGRLAIIFNNGKLIIRWNDSALTKGAAGHTVMSSSGRTYQSDTASWIIRQPAAADEIVAVGRWPDMPAELIWKIRCRGEKEFSWDVTLQARAQARIEDYTARLILTDEYEGWFTSQEEYVFPEAFLHENEWQSRRIDDHLNWLIGLKTGADSGEGLPTLVLDSSGADKQGACQIGNTGIEASARGIQFNYVNPEPEHAAGSYKFFSTGVKLFEERDRQDFECYMARARQAGRRRIISRGPLALCCGQRKIEIFLRDALLSSGAGLDTKFIWQGRTYSAAGGNWSVEKEGDNYLVVNIFWGPEAPFFQVWRMELRDESAIFWQADMEIRDGLEIRNRQVELFLSGRYDRWFTPSENGDFGAVEKKGNTVILSKYINDFSGVEQSCLMPAVTFANQDGRARVSYISRGQDKELNTKLHYLEIDPAADAALEAGRHAFFKGAIRIAPRQGQKGVDAVVNNNGAAAAINFNGVSLDFRHGRMRLFYEGVELTKGLGLYSAVLHEGNWHDSSQGLWKVEASDRERFVAVGRWPWLPVRQEWEVTLLDGRDIIWRITRDTRDGFDPDKEQVNLMLSDNYREWFVRERARGRFPEEFAEHTRGGFWERLWSAAAQSPVGAKGPGLPSVLLDCSESPVPGRLCIENTDALFKARVLQCESAQQKHFSGKIKIC
ncbi:MAG: ABC transporter ATP-binding protein [Candidatus Omnitrophica bacterium]|nr:ABC transporter ATP-binding protein [Candidatus Omnitrophota bacterium]